MTVSISFTVLAFAFLVLFIGHSTKKGIWNLLAIPAFIFLAIENAEHVLLAFGFSMSAIVVLVTTIFMGGNE